MKHLVTIIFLLFVFDANSNLLAQSVETEQAVPTLLPMGSDDFDVDTRSHYSITGSTRWQKGYLVLSEGATISRSFNGGPWAKVDLQLKVPNLTETHPDGELRVGFLLDGRNQYVFRLQRKWTATGIVGSLALIAISENDGQVKEQIVRERTLDNVNFQQLTVELRQGLFRISSNKDTLLLSYPTESSLAIAGYRAETTRSAVAISQLSISRSMLPPKSTAEQQKQEAKALAKFASASSLSQEGKLDKAAANLEEACEIARSLLGKYNLTYGQLLESLAVVYDKMSDAARVTRLYQELIEIRKYALGDHHPIYAATLIQLGDRYSGMGDYVYAEPLFIQAALIMKEVYGDQDINFSKSLARISSVSWSTGDFSRAMRLEVKAIEILKSIVGENDPNYAASLLFLSEICKAAKEYERRDQLVVQAMKIFEQLNSEQYSQWVPLKIDCLAGFHLRNGKFAQAVELFEKVRESEGASVSDFTLMNLALAYELMGDRENAERYYKQSVEISRAKLDRNAMLQSERQQFTNQRLRRFMFDNRLNNLLKSNAAATPVIETHWRWKGAVTESQHAYRQVASDPNLAPTFSRVKSISYELSAIAGRAPVPPQTSANKAEQDLHRQKQDLWQQQLNALTREKEELERQIAGSSQEFRRLSEPLLVGMIQDVLPNGTAFVDFLEYRHMTWDSKNGDTEYERRYMGFVVRKDRSPVMVGLGSAKTIAQAIIEFRGPFQKSELASQDRSTAVAAAKKIRVDLWQPIEEHLDDIDTVIISPDTELGTLPFSALPGKAEGSYLLEDYRLAMVPTANLMYRLLNSDSANARRPGLLVVGDVDYNAPSELPEAGSGDSMLIAAAQELRGGTNRWHSLKGFREELNAVESLYLDRFGSESPLQTLAGAAASELEFLKHAPQYGTLHLVTHGYFEDAGARSLAQEQEKYDERLFQIRGSTPFKETFVPGLLSGLVLAGANAPAKDPQDPRDGILRASEIESVPLEDVDLVVLSACETGLGKVGGGEGMTGLQRAFQMAGARTVIASLWKVDDDATLNLMTEFYRNLWKNNMSKIDALRGAQLTMLRSYDPKLGKLRGLGQKSIEVSPAKPNQSISNENASLDPMYWAAFQLSGDWQ